MKDAMWSLGDVSLTQRAEGHRAFAPKISVGEVLTMLQQLPWINGHVRRRRRRRCAKWLLLTKSRP